MVSLKQVIQQRHNVDHWRFIRVNSPHHLERDGNEISSAIHLEAAFFATPISPRYGSLPGNGRHEPETLDRLEQ